MFSDLQRAIVNYLQGKELIQQHGIHVWTNSDGDLDMMIESQLNALHPLAIIVLDIAPKSLSQTDGWLDMSLDVVIRLVENITLNQSPVHAIDLIFPLLQWLHSWQPGDIYGVSGILMANPEQPVMDEQADPGKLQKVFNFTIAAQGETDHSTLYNQ